MKKRAAFTLVELSIVLVILGLLVGGVLTGQALIRASELRSVTTQHASIITAVQAFRDKYFALPGDMTNAQTFWGVAHATPGTCVTTASTDTKTCNGDGDGSLRMPGSSNEMFRFWQHLANAGLIEGRFDGIAHGTHYSSATTANSPSGRIASSLWFPASTTPLSGQTTIFDGVYDNYLFFGGVTPNIYPQTGVLKPEEAWNIDTKMDDGKPATGKLVIFAVGGLATCTDTALSTNMAANYLLNSSALACALDFRQAF